MQRPILGLLAAATLSLGVAGTAPAQATASAPLTAPAHDDDRDNHRFTRQHGHDSHDDDDDDDHGHHDRGRRGRRCEGHLITICLL